MTLDDDGTNQNTVVVYRSKDDGRWHAAIGPSAGPAIERCGPTAAQALLRLSWAIEDTAYRLDPKWTPERGRLKNVSVETRIPKVVKQHDPFKRAAAPAPPSKPEKGTTWAVDDAMAVAIDITEFNRLSAEAKALKTKLEAVKGRIEAHADQTLIPWWALFGELPEAPIKITCPFSGQSISYVVQDRTAGYAPSVEQVADLVAVFDAGFEPFLVDSTTYSFDADVLALRATDPETGKRSTIQAMISRRIGTMLKILVQDGELRLDQAESLLTVETRRTFEPGFLARLPELVGRDAGRLARAVAAMGSAVVRFVKAG